MLDKPTWEYVLTFVLADSAVSLPDECDLSTMNAESQLRIIQQPVTTYWNSRAQDDDDLPDGPTRWPCRSTAEITTANSYVFGFNEALE